MRDASPVDTLCGTLVNGIRLSLATWTAAYNLLDPWAPVRAYMRISRDLTSAARNS